MDNEKDKNNTQEAESTVQVTTNYSLFKYIESNRTVNKSHVQHLISSFEANPELVKTRPILVNESMEVIDGQHRLQACMTLHIPVYYMVASGTNVESAQLMNALQRGWSVIDFARSFALNRNNADRAKVYKTFLQLYEEYRFPVTLLIMFCEQRKRTNYTASFKRGEFFIKDEELTRAQLNMVEEIMEVVPRDIKNKYTFSHALFTILRHPDYDHERMLKKLRSKQITPQFEMTSYLRELEKIYNDGYGEENRVRFF